MVETLPSSSGGEPDPKVKEEKKVLSFLFCFFIESEPLDIVARSFLSSFSFRVSSARDPAEEVGEDLFLFFFFFLRVSLDVRPGLAAASLTLSRRYYVDKNDVSIDCVTFAESSRKGGKGEKILDVKHYASDGGETVKRV